MSTLLLIRHIRQIRIRGDIIQGSTTHHLQTTSFSIRRHQITRRTHTCLGITRRMGTTILSLRHFTLTRTHTTTTILSAITTNVNRMGHTLTMTSRHIIIKRIALTVQGSPITVITPTGRPTDLLRNLLTRVHKRRLLNIRRFRGRFRSSTPYNRLPQLATYKSPGKQ